MFVWFWPKIEEDCFYHFSVHASISFSCGILGGGEGLGNQILPERN
jgi:hypothetical protein